MNDIDKNCWDWYVSHFEIGYSLGSSPNITLTTMNEAIDRFKDDHRCGASFYCECFIYKIDPKTKCVLLKLTLKEAKRLLKLNQI